MEPSDEQRWIEAWRYATPELEKIRARELRSLSADAGAPRQNNQKSERCGLEDFQQWMMRWRVQQYLEQSRRDDA